MEPNTATDVAVDDSSTGDTIVIDTGSSLTKVGYSGEDSPRARFATVVGANTEKGAANLNASSVSSDPVGDDDKLYYAGDAVFEDKERRQKLALTKPVHRTVVQDWDALENLWEWSFTEELNVDPESFPVLLMDSVLEPKKSREMMAKIMFEKFNVKSFYVASEAVLSLFSSGVTSGLVLECGDEISRAVPIFEGFALRHAVSTSRLASRNAYGHFGKALQVFIDFIVYACTVTFQKGPCVESFLLYTASTD